MKQRQVTTKTYVETRGGYQKPQTRQVVLRRIKRSDICKSWYQQANRLVDERLYLRNVMYSKQNIVRVTTCNTSCCITRYQNRKIGYLYLGTFLFYVVNGCVSAFAFPPKNRSLFNKFIYTHARTDTRAHTHEG